MTVKKPKQIKKKKNPTPNPTQNNNNKLPKTFTILVRCS